MKKIIAVMMLVIVLMSTGCAYAELTNEEYEFCAGFGREYVECDDGSVVGYWIINDTLQHIVGIYADSPDAETVQVKIFRGGLCAPSTLVGGPYEVDCNDCDETLENIVQNLYNIEAVEHDYAAGKVSEEYLNTMLFKYRFTVYGY